MTKRLKYATMKEHLDTLAIFQNRTFSGTEYLVSDVRHSYDCQFISLVQGRTR